MKLISGAFRMLYWPLCRAYATYLGDRPSDIIFRHLCALQYWKEYGRWPDFVRPRRFSEKVWSRQLHERDPRIMMISDKFRVRDYVAEKVGIDYLVPLLWDGERPEDIPFDELPLQFVIKTNHGCGYNIIVNERTGLDYKITIKQLKKWMNENFGREKYLGIAWAYRNITPHIIIEEFVGEQGRVPVDYKFFCFSGRMEFFKIDFDRFANHSTLFFDKELRMLDVVEVGFERYQGNIVLPVGFGDMVAVAEVLANEFDFMRVDLFNVGGRIFFGELTAYPGGIFQKLMPERFDYEFGEKWRLVSYKSGFAQDG